ncbi:hypothetical protein AB0L26_28420 [Streptomyces nondiastaticus]|uniref:hypothetical protein n=1 Tax=Streptomyces nondiastaticus TaxID=3154512 RepID=UPI00342C160E
MSETSGRQGQETMGGREATTVVPGGTVKGPAYRPPAPVSGARKALGSLLWAVGLTALLLFGAGLAQWVLLLGVVVMMAGVAVTACLIGGVWHRAGAATLASVGGFALMLFAGPAMYEVYMKTVGEPVPAVVTEVTDRHARKGASMFCTVEETGGGHEKHSVSEQQNCFGQAREGDRVEIRKDPLGLLDPRLPDGPDQQDSTRIAVYASAGLGLLTAATIFYGGQRRRAG